MDHSGRDDFEAFVRARLPDLLRFGYALTGNEHDASDLVQDALERTGVRWAALRRRDDPEGYVRRAMTNRSISRWRRRGRRREVLMAAPPELAADRDDLEARDEVWTALAALPPRQRAVLVLRYYEDLSEAEIADQLGCSPGTVKSQAAKARAHLRAVLTAAQEPVIEERTWTS